MPVSNSDISDKLREAADLLEIKGADEFRVRSYRQALDYSNSVHPWEVS